MQLNEIELINEAVLGALDIVDQSGSHYLLILIDADGRRNVVTTLEKPEARELLGQTFSVYDATLKSEQN